MGSPGPSTWKKEENIQKQKQLRKLWDETLKSALADDTQAILDCDGTLDRQSLQALITKRTQGRTQRALAKMKVGDKTNSKEDKNSKKGSDAKEESRGHDGAAGQKKSVTPKKTSKKKGNGEKGGSNGGKGKDSSNTPKGKGGGQSSNKSAKKGKGSSKGKGGSNKK